MSNKNPWFGSKCTLCETVWDDAYISNPHYSHNSTHETLSGRKMWTCGKCNFEHKEHLKDLAKRLEKGIITRK